VIDADVSDRVVGCRLPQNTWTVPEGPALKNRPALFAVFEYDINAFQIVIAV
jgi:hypothetical protein